MNKYFAIFLLFFALAFSSCKKEICNPPTDLSLEYYADGTAVQIFFNASYNQIEMEYGPAGYVAGNGTKFTNKQINDLDNGDYDIYVRLNCNGSEWSNWSEKLSATILDSTQVCFPPVSRYTVDLGCEAKFGWYNNNNGLSSNYYQVEYGVTGFSLGTGTTEIVNGNDFKDAILTEGTTYDFYVKTNCGGSSWSEYSSVESFYASKNYNRCLVPKNVDAFRSGTSLPYSFDSDGECEFEYTLITSNQSVGDEQIYSTTNLSHSSQFTGINTFSTYHFMVRSVCKDGSKTAWVTKVVLP